MQLVDESARRKFDRFLNEEDLPEAMAGAPCSAEAAARRIATHADRQFMFGSMPDGNANEDDCVAACFGLPDNQLRLQIFACRADGLWQRYDYVLVIAAERPHKEARETVSREGDPALTRYRWRAGNDRASTRR